MSELDQTDNDDRVIVLVTSNGTIRLIAPDLGIEATDAKVKTGNLCFLNRDNLGNIHVDEWDIDPDNV